MKMLSKGIATAACLTMALLSLWNTVQFGPRSEPQALPDDPYGIAERHARFAALTAKLGAEKSVGFITNNYDPVWHDALFMGTAYELAPRFVLRNDAARFPEFVVGSFRPPVDPDPIARANGLLTIEDFGDGVVLFRRTASK